MREKLKYSAFNKDGLSESNRGDERAILNCLRQGDHDALRDLHNFHWDAVYQFAKDRVAFPHDAEDITQEAFLTLWAKRATLELSEKGFRSWLLVAALHISRNHLRTRNRRACESLCDVDREFYPTLDEVVNCNLTFESLKYSIARLPQEDQQIFQLCLLEGHTYQQAASRLRISHSAVRNRLSRLRGSLRNRLGA